MISIVMAVHFSDGADEFVKRIRKALPHNFELIRRQKLDAEFIFVDWNSGRNSRLKNMLDGMLFPGQCRIVRVPPCVHDAWSSNPASPFMQFHAKNVGIRQAKGEWILAMNTDAILTRNIISKLHSAHKLDQHVCYIADRWSFAIDYNVPSDSAKKGLFKLQSRYVTKKECFLDNKMDYGAPGDFTLMHRSLWEFCRGYFEGIRFSNIHMDTLLCRQVEKLGGTVRSVGHVYHVMHDEAYRHTRSPEKTHHGSDYPWSHVELPYLNPLRWGQAEVAFKGAGPVRTMASFRLPSGIPANPEPIVRWPEFEGKLKRSLNRFRRLGKPVVLLGPGAECKKLWEENKACFPRIHGYIGKSSVSWLDNRIRRLSWKKAEGYPLIIGSCWWAYSLAEQARKKGLERYIYPICFRNKNRYGLRPEKPACSK